MVRGLCIFVWQFMNAACKPTDGPSGAVPGQPHERGRCPAPCARVRAGGPGAGGDAGRKGQLARQAVVFGGWRPLGHRGGPEELKQINYIIYYINKCDFHLRLSQLDVSLARQCFQMKPHSPSLFSSQSFLHLDMLLSGSWGSSAKYLSRSTSRFP